MGGEEERGTPPRGPGGPPNNRVWGPSRRETPLMTESRAERGTTFLLPPLSMEIVIEQVVKDHCIVRVRCRSGAHCFIHRAIVSRYDATDNIDVLVESGLYKWIAWLLGFEAQRRQESSSRRWQSRLPLPEWPAPDPVLSVNEPVPST